VQGSPTPTVFSAAGPGLGSLVARPATDTDWYTGLPIAEDQHDWYQAISGGGWIDQSLTTTGLVGDLVNLTNDLPGTLAAWAATHPKPRHSAKPWIKLARHASDTGQRLDHTVDQAPWTADAADRYKTAADTSRDPAVLSPRLRFPGLSAILWVSR
jgi:hypothetical protein